MLPLSIAPANEDVDPNGTGILRSVDFGLYIKQSFIVDNFKVVKEITNDSTNSNNSMLLPTDVYIWTNSNKVLCFDVYETDKQVSQQDRTAVFNLVDNKHGKEWKSVSSLIKINFADIAVTRWDGAEIAGASLIYMGNGWYQVILPLSTIPTLENVCKEHPISIINFNYKYVNRSFLVDFNVDNSLEGKGDLDRNGLLDPSDASTLSKNLSGNEISSLRSGKVADLDQNGVINAVDLTHLKRMMLSQ